MGRAVVAVIVGFVVWSILWVLVGVGLKAAAPGSFDAAGITRDATILGAALAASVIVSLLSGISLTLLTPRDPGRAALSLGLLLLIVGIAVQASAWSQIPLWYHLSFLALLIPATWIGATLRGRAQLTPRR